MTGHSPAPFTIEQESHLGDVAYSVIAADGDRIAVGCLRVDAVLFAAAPDLLEALRKLADTCTLRALRGWDYTPAMRDQQDAVADAYAAIAKATPTP